MNRINALYLIVFLVPALSACFSDATTPETATPAATTLETSRSETKTETRHEVALASAHKADITVYKSPTCGCCKDWVTYLQEEGFNVTAIDHDDVDSIKLKHGLVNPDLKSCHTALVEGYIVEGHVPASDIERLLKTRPTDIKGLTAPGMPMMSPGMASRTPKDYAVLSFTEAGKSKVYSQY